MAPTTSNDTLSTFAAAALSGSAASLASSAALAIGGLLENDSAAAPTNATSHWVWGRKAYAADGYSLRHTALGYLIHHSMSFLWALAYEACQGPVPRKPPQAVRDAALVAAAACVVDYTITPRRLRPGFEVRLSKRSMAFVYAAFAAGLAGATLARRR